LCTPFYGAEMFSLQMRSDFGFGESSSNTLLLPAADSPSQSAGRPRVQIAHAQVRDSVAGGHAIATVGKVIKPELMFIFLQVGKRIIEVVKILSLPIVLWLTGENFGIHPVTRVEFSLERRKKAKYFTFANKSRPPSHATGLRYFRFSACHFLPVQKRLNAGSSASNSHRRFNQMRWRGARICWNK
jgi:hypothetical protein